MTGENRLVENKEILQPESVFIVGPVYQPKWYPGEADPTKEGLSDKIRGDLILANLKKANELGYSVALIHSPGDNKDFVAALKDMSGSTGNNKIIVEAQHETTYSGSRRDALRLARQEPNCKVIVMLELEKPMIEHIPAMVLPILNGTTDVTITDRQIQTGDTISNDPEAPGENLRGLPVYQARSEHVFSTWADNLLKKAGIMPQDFPPIDWMGNRAWRNDPKINSIFLARYTKSSDAGDHINIDPDHLSSALFFPLAQVLYDKLRLVSVPIDYHHPKEQTELENRDSSFKAKRDRQRETLMLEMAEFVKLLEGSANSLSS